MRTTLSDREDHDKHPIGSFWFSCIYTWLLWTLGVIPLEYYPEGLTQDISPLRRLYWWTKPVYFKKADAPFPSTSREERGHFVRISHNVGHSMTYYKSHCDWSLKVFHQANPPKSTFWIHLMGRIYPHLPASPRQ